MNHHLPPPDYATFELLISVRQGELYPVTVVQSLVGVGKADCQLDPQTDDLLKAIEQLSGGSITVEVMRQVGALLFDRLFSGTVAILLRAHLAVARAQKKQIRLKLRFDAHELASLPWEYLYDSTSTLFLVTAADITLVRYLPLPLPARPMQVKPPLRLLLVIASPIDEVPLDVEAEKESIQQALSEAIQQGLITLHVVEEATIEQISQALRQSQPHIFHFIGHGSFDGEAARVLLEDEAQRARPVDELQFRHLLSISQEMRLAILNSCQSAKLSASQAMVGLAPQLLDSHLAAVIAMQFPIRDRTSLIFSRDFYRSLALGYPVDAAIGQARQGILLERGHEQSDWGIPVLFLRSEDGQLFQIEEREPHVGQKVAPPPPIPTKPPLLKEFVGREQEITFYRNQLQANGVAILAGMPGVGKTQLMAKIAERVGVKGKLFWHCFYQGESVLNLIWKLAAFLAHTGNDQLWQMLHAAQGSGTQSTPPAIWLDYLFQQLQGQDYLLCLDDFHLLYDGKDDDPLLEQAIGLIRSITGGEQLKLLVATRRTPSIHQFIVSDVLAGLTRSDSQHFLQKQGIDLNESLLDELHERTEGNAELLKLFAHAWQQHKDPPQLIAQLATADRIEEYLLNEIDANLSEDQRAVMHGVAILLGYPGTRQEIESTQAAKEVRRTLAYLTNRYLLTTLAEGTIKRYVQHALVQSFYYELLGEPERREMHQRIALYYENKERDLLKAALHALHAGDEEKAARLATQDVWLNLGRGHAKFLKGLLGEIQMASLNIPLQIHVETAQGEIDHFFGNVESAQEHYNTALLLLERQPDEPTARQQQAYLCQVMGELLYSESPQTILDWLTRGLEAIHGMVDAKSIQQRAALLIHQGALYTQISEFTQAEARIQEGLQRLSDPDSSLRFDALINLCSIYSYRGQAEAVQRYTQEALMICDHLNDPYRRLKLLSHLALLKEDLGDWENALLNHQSALQEAKALGYVVGQALELTNLGYLLTRLNRFEQASLYLQEGLVLAQRHHLWNGASLIQINLAHIAFQQQQWATVFTRLEEAEKIAATLEIVDTIPEVAILRAQVYLAQNDVSKAQQTVDFALAEAIRLGKEVEQGIAWRVFGQVLWAEGKKEEAFAAIAHSLAILEGEDHFEFTRTQQVQEGLQ